MREIKRYGVKKNLGGENFNRKIEAWWVLKYISQKWVFTAMDYMALLLLWVDLQVDLSSFSKLHEQTHK